jgi:hypothetical protein
MHAFEKSLSSCGHPAVVSELHYFISAINAIQSNGDRAFPMTAVSSHNVAFA